MKRIMILLKYINQWVFRLYLILLITFFVSSCNHINQELRLELKNQIKEIELNKKEKNVKIHFENINSRSLIKTLIIEFDLNIIYSVSNDILIKEINFSSDKSRILFELRDFFSQYYNCYINNNKLVISDKDDQKNSSNNNYIKSLNFQSSNINNYYQDNISIIKDYNESLKNIYNVKMYIVKSSVYDVFDLSIDSIGVDQTYLFSDGKLFLDIFDELLSFINISIGNTSIMYNYSSECLPNNNYSISDYFIYQDLKSTYIDKNVISENVEKAYGLNLNFIINDINMNTYLKIKLSLSRSKSDKLESEGVYLINKGQIKIITLSSLSNSNESGIIKYSDQSRKEYYYLIIYVE